jgi:hypothetical protein
MGSDFRRQIENLSQPQLVRLHRDEQRRCISGQTSIAIGFVGAIPSHGLSLFGSALGANRLAKGSVRVGIIEERLRKEGWSGHKLGFRDYAPSVGVGLVGFELGSLADSLMGGDSGGGATVDYSSAADTSTFDNSGIDTSTFDASGVDTSGMASSDNVDTSTFTDASGAVPFDGSEFVGNPTDSSMFPTDMPTVDWEVTDNGVQMMINGVPIDSSYGQLDPSGLYQIPIDPNDLSAGSILMWSDPTSPDFDLLDTNGIPSDSIYESNGLDPLGMGPGAAMEPGSGEYPAGIDNLISQIGQPVPADNFGGVDNLDIDSLQIGPGAGLEPGVGEYPVGIDNLIDQLTQPISPDNLVTDSLNVGPGAGSYPDGIDNLVSQLTQLIPTDGLTPDFIQMGPGEGLSPGVGEYPAGIDSLISQLTQPIPADASSSVPLPALDTAHFTDLQGIAMDPTQYTLSGVGPYVDPTDQFVNQALPANSSGLLQAQYANGANAALVQTAILGGTTAVVHATSHTIPHLAHEGAKLAIQQLGKWGFQKSWEKVEDGHGLDRPPSYETVVAESSANHQQPQNSQEPTQQKSTEERRTDLEETHDPPKVVEAEQEDTSDIFANLEPHQHECLIALRHCGYEEKLNEPERLLFYIEQADGNTDFAMAWIDQYVNQAKEQVS